jgi:GTP-binding protein HflX
LLNAFSPAKAYVDDRLFATLDTKTRLVHLVDGTQALLTDTVGFIRHLPHGLVASFRSTLEVANDADLLLVVADASHSHMDDHLAVVRETLVEIGADQVPSLLVLNKCDRAQAREGLAELQTAHPDAIAVSAKARLNLDVLRERIRDALAATMASEGIE